MNMAGRRWHQAGFRLLGLALGTAIFFSYSCHPQRPQPPQVAPVPPPPASVVPPSDPQTTYQTTYGAVLQGDTAEKRREIFRIGYRMLQEKNRDGARFFLSRALEVYPTLADYSLYFLGVLSREDGH